MLELLNGIKNESIIEAPFLSRDMIPSPLEAQAMAREHLPLEMFPRLGKSIGVRLAESFPNWNQCMPELRVARQDWRTLPASLDRMGRALPLAVVAQVSYGHGMGHPRFGLFRQPCFDGECAHTYVYHAAPGRSLRGEQACDYHRIDHVSRKPTLYCFWLLSNEMVRIGADELHRRWKQYRYHTSDPNRFDCSKFVTDFARYLASVGLDPNNPFNYSIPSHTILDPCSAEDRGLFGILKYAHRPPALLLFVQDPWTFDRISANGFHDGLGWVVEGDAAEFNVTQQ